ncbi:MAG: hypothetical protein A3D24_00025 [Candidatus Blackburnbacteria bacterium RIFCSPHIGHO2_02_FULL_39_13]|nr:MAG: hypothetical protein A3D24_00025 [Candidatus Blackburnbacteria bacterium RIFCSPHIGHO2_02_FULL_39_13]HBL52096.1 hypothetical protein [Candidatus Blackburnbacteria bacterium]
MEERPHLYIIPIAHTYADMGNLSDKIPFDERYEAMVTGYWVGIFRYLNSLPSDFLAGLQIYQDGLVNVSREIVDRIVNETKTANYEILRWLKGKGAAILGTEDANLLMEDYQALQAIVNCTEGEVKAVARLEYFKKSSWLLEERDKSIAQRIKETLPRGKTGLLFIGAAHDVGPLLSNEIRVTTPEMVSRVLPEVIRSFYNLRKERR